MVVCSFLFASCYGKHKNEHLYVMLFPKEISTSWISGYECFNGPWLCNVIFCFPGGSAYFSTSSMSTNPFNSKTFKHLAQDMSLLLERFFLIVRKGPSRIYKPNL